MFEEIMGKLDSQKMGEIKLKRQEEEERKKEEVKDKRIGRSEIKFDLSY